jgi:hypothetical protein
MKNQELQKETQFQSENISILKTKLDELLLILSQQQTKNEQLSIEKQKIQSESLALSMKLNEMQNKNLKNSITLPILNNNLERMNSSSENKADYRDLWVKKEIFIHIL